jgi:hypothetical protein
LARALDAQARPVDVRDRADLIGFAEGCRVVVNCAGPAH